jgi:ATPase subunit of ABC transporter with duplicated ATPase domains
MKKYQWEQEQVAKTKSFIARFGSGSRASQAQSREKTLAKMMESGLTEKVTQEKVKLSPSFLPSFFYFHLFLYLIRLYH